MAYPSTFDSLSTTHADGIGEVIAAAHVNSAAAAINAIEAELGLLPKGADASVRARLDKINPTSPSAYTISNSSTLRTLDVSSYTMDNLANALSTLIADLRTRGLVG